MGMSTSKLAMSYRMQEDAEGKFKNLKTVPRRLEYYATNIPDREAFVFVSAGGGRKVITFETLYGISLIVARALIKLGIKPKEYLAVCLRPCPEWLYVTFGAMIAGARPFGASFVCKDGSDLVVTLQKLQTCTCMVMDPGYENENWKIMLKLIDDVSSDGSVTSKYLPFLRYLFIHRSNNDMLWDDRITSRNDIHGKFDHSCEKLSTFKAMSFQDLLLLSDENATLPTICDEDVAMIFRTSGSTGHSKFVSHTHFSITTVYDFIAENEFCQNDVYFTDRPFEWAGGFPFEIFIGQKRVTYLTSPDEDKGFIMETLLKEECNVIIATPTTLSIVEEQKTRFRPNWRLKGIYTDGEPITRNLCVSLESVTKTFIVCYGPSEVLLATIHAFENCGDFTDFDCGLIAPGCEIKIVDEEGEIVPIDTRGEIYIRSKRMFTGYADDMMKTSVVLSSDGWYKTNDIGRMLENGSLLVEGRKSNMIISKGIKIIPEILENGIRNCPGVQDVVLIVIPDEEMCQDVCACVKVVPGSGVDSEVVRQFCEKEYVGQKQAFTIMPNSFLIVDEFPLTKTGKVSRRVLVEHVRQNKLKK